MSLAEVARLAGVSLATASRVANNTDYPVGDATRLRVLAAVEQLNYSPSTLARALATQKSKIVGIIVHDILDPYFAEIVRGAQDVAHEHDYLTIVCNSDREVSTEVKYLRMLRDYQAEGVIFAAGGLTGEGADELDQLIAQMKVRKRPTRIVALAQQPFEATLVTIDNRTACREMTDYLLALGHRRIGFISGPEHLITSELRLQGFVDATAASGWEAPAEYITPGNFDLESGRRAANTLMNLPEPPTAIFAANDEMAIGCMGGLRKLGLEIPRDVTVVGFDDLKLLQSVDPLLTTIHVPLHELGATAMSQLLRTFQGETIEPVKVLKHELVVRASSASPPANQHQGSGIE